MEPKFWHERWQNHRIGFHQNETNRYLAQHWNTLKLPKKTTVLVPLCGKSLDMVWLRNQGHQVLGVELSPIAVQEFFEENQMQATHASQGKFERWEADGIALLCGNLFDLTASDLNEVKGIYDRAALIALPPQMRQKYANHLATALPKSVRSLLITIDYPQNERGGPPFSVPHEEVQNLFKPNFDLTLLKSENVLSDNPRFRDTSRLSESAYLLTSK